MVNAHARRLPGTSNRAYGGLNENEAYERILRNRALYRHKSEM